MAARKGPKKAAPPRQYADEDERNLYLDFEHKHVRIPPPPAIGGILNKLLARRGYSRIQANVAEGELWKKVAGERFVSDTRPGLIKAGVWQITVRNSMVSQELSFCLTEFLRAINAAAPELKIKGLKLKVGPVD